MPEKSRDFTASCYIVRGDRVLLIDHSKLGKWLQPGGHIEPLEAPHEAAIREAREETGYRVEIHPRHQPDQTSFPDSTNLPTPFRVNKHQITPEGEDHFHIDFAYLGVVEEYDANHETDEHVEQRWFTQTGLTQDDLRIDENTQRSAIEAIDLS